MEGRAGPDNESSRFIRCQTYTGDANRILLLFDDKRLRAQQNVPDKQ